MDATANVPMMVLPVHRLTPWFRLRISHREDSIRTEHWQSALGFIPVRRRRLDVPYGQLVAARIRTTTRVQCLVAAALAVGAIFVLHPPVYAIVLLAIFGLYQLALAAPNSAVRIERTDGRVYTVRFCRDYAFDVSLAFEEAARPAQPKIAEEAQSGGEVAA